MRGHRPDLKAIDGGAKSTDAPKPMGPKPV